jgi:nucleoside-diphosphate-sugar epimerase
MQFGNVNRFRDLLFKLEDIPVVIGAGSQAELGPLEGPAYEDLADNPVTDYGNAKVEARKLFQQRFENSIGTRFVWARIFSTYGPLDSDKWLIPSLIRAQINETPLDLTEGKQLWNFTHAFDFATAVHQAILDSQIRNVVHMASPGTISIREVGDYIEELGGKRGLFNWGAREAREAEVMLLDPRSSVLSKSGWSPSIDLWRGISHLFSWHAGDFSKANEILSSQFLGLKI